jgi:uncharacterized membrane protein
VKPAYLGLTTAILFLIASLSPSLLPRHWVFQAVVSGVVTAVAYGFGTLVSHLWRTFISWEPPSEVKVIAWRLLAVGGPIAVVAAWIYGVERQRTLHRLMGMEIPSSWGYLLGIVLGLVLAVVLVSISRGIRLVARRIATFLDRWLPARLAGILAGVIVGLVAIGLLDGVVVDRLFQAADETFRVSDRAIPDDAVQPQDPLRSGSPESLVAWEDLGSKGRTFVAEGPTAEEIAEFTGRPAEDPIRVYVGLASAKTVEARAELVVAELERTGAFDRRVLCVITATGTGWVDPEAAAALEFIWGGDTALASMQYSYLPSWISFVVDSSRAREAGRELFELVYERWASLPEDDRPLLLVMGESLGADGSESAFSGLADIRNRVDGVLWIGPPNFSELWSEFVADRDPASPQWLPVYEGGETVRFAADPSHLDPEDPSWKRPRVLYLQQPSDPVVWWTPRLALRRPDWLGEPRGPDVLPQVEWFPIVTFLQLTADLANSIQVPPGHGHNYAGLVADGWAAVAAPEYWTPADTTRLRARMIAQSFETGSSPSN